MYVTFSSRESTEEVCTLHQMVPLKPPTSTMAPGPPEATHLHHGSRAPQSIVLAARTSDDGPTDSSGQAAISIAPTAQLDLAITSHAYV